MAITVKVNGGFVAGVFGYTIAFALVVIGTVTPSWIMFTLSGNNRGLFSICNMDGSCVPIDTVSDLENTVKYMSIFGIGMGAVGLLLALFFMLRYIKTSPNTALLANCSMVFSTLAGLVVFIGDMIYEVNVYSEDNFGNMQYIYSSFGYSFPMSIVGAILMFTVGPILSKSASKMVFDGVYPPTTLSQPDPTVIINTQFSFVNQVDESLQKVTKPIGPPTYSESQSMCHAGLPTIPPPPYSEK
ncbi:uncharacterized protein LOC131948175 [Physella acuta]|uniref:uncharacterized protein LOC131948175 n=1 Tax=Physella acuta TaxID=109671 RepID=UPI0027DB290B|nr:uncharacterized protein LOC131948175 [Physella acuta]